MIFTKKKSSLKYKLLFWVWISTSITTAIFTGIQVYSEYSVDVDTAKKQLTTIEESYISQIKESLWDFNEKYANIQAESISKLNYVSYVELLMDKNRIFSSGTFVNNQKEGVREYPLDHEGKILGKLLVQLNLHDIQKGYLKKVLKIFALQSIKTFIVCWLLLFLFSKLIVKHIFQISSYMNEFNLDENKQLNLERSDKEEEDELSVLVDNINILRKKLYDANMANKAFTENLELLIAERTKELEVTKAKAIHSSKMAALGEMAGGVAHEINNPLTIIASSVMILEKAKMKNKMTDDYFIQVTSSIKSTVKRIADIVNGLRAVSRGGEETEKREESLSAILSNVVGLCREKFKNRGIQLRVDSLHIQSDDIIYCNQTLMSQVFINLINNAFDAVGEQNTEGGWVGIEVEENDHFYHVKILDSGPGVPEEIQDKIFNPFFTSKEIGKGTGLGLSISLGILKEIGGEIFLDTSAKKTCFVVSIPKQLKNNIEDKKVENL